MAVDGAFGFAVGVEWGWEGVVGSDAVWVRGLGGDFFGSLLLDVFFGSVGRCGAVGVFGDAVEVWVGVAVVVWSGAGFDADFFGAVSGVDCVVVGCFVFGFVGFDSVEGVVGRFLRGLGDDFVADVGRVLEGFLLTVGVVVAG